MRAVPGHWRCSRRIDARQSQPPHLSFSFACRRCSFVVRGNGAPAGWPGSCGRSFNSIGFWADRLPPSRKGTSWDQILQVLATYRLIAPGSEWRLHREWFGNSAMPDLLGADFGLAEEHKLYACHDLLLAHKEALLTRRLHALAPGLTARSALEKFAAVQMIDVHLPTTDGREILLTRYTHPEPELQLLIDRLKLRLPPQPPPRITSAALNQATRCSEDLLT
jgi:hypothetical protein